MTTPNKKYIQRTNSNIQLEDIIDNAHLVHSLNLWTQYRSYREGLPNGWFVWDGSHSIYYLNNDGVCIERYYNNWLTLHKANLEMDKWYKELDKASE